MKISLSTAEVADHLKKDESANWSHEAAWALAEHFDQLETDTGEDIEIDLVAIRCEWTEYGNPREALEAYDSISRYLVLDNSDAENNKLIIEAFRHRTTVIELSSGGIIIQAF
jgi:hypothetical protein